MKNIFKGKKKAQFFLCSNIQLFYYNGVKARITGVISVGGFCFSSVQEDILKILGGGSLHFWDIRPRKGWVALEKNL